MSSYQFPPSSPLLGSIEHNAEVDPFSISSKHGKPSVVERRSREQYPTPNPSSTTGRSSSPARENRNEEEEVDLAAKPATKKVVTFQLDSVANDKSARLLKKKTKQGSGNGKKRVRINRDFNVLNPDANVLRVPVKVDGKSSILVGRSSKLSDYYFNTSDRTISRTHLAISCKDNKIVIECLGFSGFGMRIPRACLVYGTDKSNDYILMEAKSPKESLSFQDLNSLGLKVTPRTISLDLNHTEFFVNRNERVTLPMIDNIFIQVRDNAMLLNPKDDEEDVTDDEEPVLLKEKPKIVLDTVESEQATAEDKELAMSLEREMELDLEMAHDHVSHKEVQKLREQTETPTISISSTPVKHTHELNSTPIKQFNISTPLTPAKLNIRATSEEPTPTYSKLDESELNFQIYSDNESDMNRGPSTSTPNTPLRDITNEQLRSENHPKLFKRKKLNSIAPPKTEEIDQSCVAELNNISEINNVLLNHLAFSRLSSTPASFLNTISALTSNLSLKQMRVILHNMKPIGVIYREGKDAAGKPLEEEYYYKPEEDDDIERPKLVASIKGHGGLRSCRRTHKQYYWKKPASKKK